MLGFPLVVLVGFGLGAAAASALGVAAYLPALAPVVVFGWSANRWSALALPLAWGVVFLAVVRVIDAQTGAGCSICGGDEDWASLPLFWVIGAVLPATIALVLGTGAHRTVQVWREFRRQRATSAYHPER